MITPLLGALRLSTKLLRGKEARPKQTDVAQKGQKEEGNFREGSAKCEKGKRLPRGVREGGSKTANKS